MDTRKLCTSTIESFSSRRKFSSAFLAMQTGMGAVQHRRTDRLDRRSTENTRNYALFFATAALVLPTRVLIFAY
jgi:hypothetical protein